MIELVNDKTSAKKSYPLKKAEKILREGEKLRKNAKILEIEDFKYWSLSPDSEYKFSDGSLIPKAKPKEVRESKRKEHKEASE